MIQIKKLSVSFNNEFVIRDFSMQLSQGQKLAIHGKSGIGKSTLLNVIMGFVPDFMGEVFVNSIPLNPATVQQIRKLSAWLPQEMTFNFTTVEELFHASFDLAENRDKKPSQEEISQIFEEFEIEKSLLDRKVKEISGGQKQRILLASCLLLKKPLLFLDEPTSALDVGNKKKITDYILAQKDVTVLAVTHDEYWIQQAERTLHLHDIQAI